MTQISMCICTLWLEPILFTKPIHFYSRNACTTISDETYLKSGPNPEGQFTGCLILRKMVLIQRDWIAKFASQFLFFTKQVIFFPPFLLGILRFGCNRDRFRGSTLLPNPWVWHWMSSHSLPNPYVWHWMSSHVFTGSIWATLWKNGSYDICNVPNFKYAYASRQSNESLSFHTVWIRLGTMDSS